MSEEGFLAQDEIDALLNGVRGDDVESSKQDSSGANVRPYDPRTQHRIIKDRLHSLEIINQRFARGFRGALFNLIRRNADITVDPVNFESFNNYSKNVPVPCNINLVSMKPLRGNALFVFPPSMVFVLVDNLFGGNGNFLARTEGRDFSATEQKVIEKVLKLATEAYQESWQSIFPIEIEYQRSEVQAKFANITNSPNEVIVKTNFQMEVGNSSFEFQICIPYPMIEPIKELLANPVDTDQSHGDQSWSSRISRELQESEVELVAEFLSIPSRISNILSLKVGDVLPIELPNEVVSCVDNVPVLKSGYGTQNGLKALSVKKLIGIAPDSQVKVIPLLASHSNEH